MKLASTTFFTIREANPSNKIYSNVYILYECKKWSELLLLQIIIKPETRGFSTIAVFRDFTLEFEVE